MPLAFADNQIERPHIKIIAPIWEGFTESDGSGFYWDFMEAVFHSQGYEVKKLDAPMQRAVLETRNGHAHAYMGSYLNQETRILYPRYPHDVEVTSAVWLKALDIT